MPPNSHVFRRSTWDVFLGDALPQKILRLLFQMPLVSGGNSHHLVCSLGYFWSVGSKLPVCQRRPRAVAVWLRLAFDMHLGPSNGEG